MIIYKLAKENIFFKYLETVGDLTKIQSIGNGKTYNIQSWRLLIDYVPYYENTGIMAIKADEERTWYLNPIDYWLKNFHIQDSKLNMKIEGMEEVADHTYMLLNNIPGDGNQELLRAGVLIVTNPEWYYQKPNYKDHDYEN